MQAQDVLHEHGHRLHAHRYGWIVLVWAGGATVLTMLTLLFFPLSIVHLACLTMSVSMMCVASGVIVVERLILAQPCAPYGGIRGLRLHLAIFRALEQYLSMHQWRAMLDEHDIRRHKIDHADSFLRDACAALKQGRYSKVDFSLRMAISCMNDADIVRKTRT